MLFISRAHNPALVHTYIQEQIQMRHDPPQVQHRDAARVDGHPLDGGCGRGWVHREVSLQHRH